MRPWSAVVPVAATVLLVLVTVAHAQVTADRRHALMAAVRAGEPRRELFRSLDSALLRTSWGARLAAVLAGAGFPGRSPTLVVLSVGAATVAVAALSVPLVGRVGAVVVGLGVVASAARWLDGRRRARTERFIAQLPEVSRVLANAAQAGLGLPRALELAADEVDEPAASELAQVCAELVVGRSVGSALERLRERLPSRELAVLIQTLVIQNRAGGALVTALTTISATLDDRRQLRREIRTATVGAAFSGYAVIVIAVGAVVLVNLLSPGALDLMLGTALGQAALVVSGALFGVGYVLVRRLSRVAL